MTMMDLDFPVTEVQAAEAISLLQSASFPELQMVVRRLVFERDKLRSQLAELLRLQENDDMPGWCGHCACQSCYEAQQRNDC